VLAGWNGLYCFWLLNLWALQSNLYYNPCWGQSNLVLALSSTIQTQMPIKWFNCLVTRNRRLAQVLCGLDKTARLGIKYVLQTFRDPSSRSNAASRVLSLFSNTHAWFEIEEPSFWQYFVYPVVASGRSSF
jgi:hypothetical protein